MPKLFRNCGGRLGRAFIKQCPPLAEAIRRFRAAIGASSSKMTVIALNVPNSAKRAFPIHQNTSRHAHSGHTPDRFCILPRPEKRPTAFHHPIAQIVLCETRPSRNGEAALIPFRKIQT